MASCRLVTIIGATGQLGSDLVRAAAAAGVEHASLGHEDVEVTDAVSLTRVFRRLRPSVVINTAAFHQVDRCEDDPRRAHSVNAVGASLVGQAARNHGARCVHVSTDYVFDGDKPPTPDGHLSSETAYTETDPVRPLNVYGASKAAGEQLVAQALDDYLVVRISSLFGVAGARGKNGGGNFIDTIIERARAGTPLRVVADRWMTPTYATDAATAILALALGDARGMVHVTNEGGCSWHALATAAVSFAGFTTAVAAVPAATQPSRAPRPRNSALYTGRLAALLGAPLRPWRDALRAYLAAKGHTP